MKLLTVKQVAEMLQVNEAFIYELKASKKIPFIKIGGCLRFDPDAIQNWLQEQATK